MTVEEANRFLRDPGYMRLHLTEAVKQLQSAPIEADYDDSKVIANLKHRRAVAQALLSVINLYDQAEAVLKEAAEEEVRYVGPAPMGLIEALAEPAEPAVNE